MRVKVISVFALANALHREPAANAAGYWHSHARIREALEAFDFMAELVTYEDGTSYLETPDLGLSFRDPPRFSYVEAS